MAKPTRSRPRDPSPKTAIEITQITVSMGRVYNLGNYQTLRYEVNSQATIPDGANPEDAVRELTCWLDDRLADFATERGLGHVPIEADVARPPRPGDEDDPDEDDPEDEKDP